MVSPSSWRTSWPRRCGGHEEAGVEAPRGDLGRDPVAHVVDGVDGQEQAFAAAHLDDAHPSGVELVPVADQPGGGGRRRGSRAARADRRRRRSPTGDQHAGLLEALAEGGDPEGEPTGLDAQDGARLDIVAPVAEGHGLGTGVVGVDRSPGEDVGAGHELGRQVAAQHADLDVGAAAVVGRRRAPT